MDYNDLLKSHYRFGINEEDIKNRKGYDSILENVVIAPWWNHTIFDNLNFNIEQVSEKI